MQFGAMVFSSRSGKMKSAIKIAMLFIMGTALGHAQSNPVMQVFQRIVKQPAGAGLPVQEELFSSVNEVTIVALSADEVNAVLPLGRQCLQSPSAEVRQDGLVLFMAVSLRGDSQKLLEPYIDDLGSLLNGPAGSISQRHGALYILGNTKPHLSAKALGHLNAQLEDSRNSDEEALTIAASLLENAPSDPSTVHKSLLVVSRRSNPGLTGGVLRQLGLSKSRAPEALTFIRANLGHADADVRASAVDAASRLDSDIRPQFSAELSRIASDPLESKHTRNLAAQALQP
jgi:hypothetical protein